MVHSSLFLLVEIPEIGNRVEIPKGKGEEGKGGTILNKALFFNWDHLTVIIQYLVSETFWMVSM